MKVPRVHGAGHGVRAAEDRGEWGGVGQSEEGLLQEHHSLETNICQGDTWRWDVRIILDSTKTNKSRFGQFHLEQNFVGVLEY